MELELSTQVGRTRLEVRATRLGRDLVVLVCNEGAHLGAVAVGEWDAEEGRASSSVITLRGHRDDVIAKHHAQELARRLRRPVCVLCGVHVDRITSAEIEEVLRGVEALVAEMAERLGTPEADRQDTK